MEQQKQKQQPQKMASSSTSRRTAEAKANPHDDADEEQSIQDQLTQGVDTSRQIHNANKSPSSSTNTNTTIATKQPSLLHHQTATLTSVLDNMQMNETVYEFGSNSANVVGDSGNNISVVSSSSSTGVGAASSQPSTPNSSSSHQIKISSMNSGNNINNCSVSSSSSNQTASNRNVLSSPTQAIQSPNQTTKQSITSSQQPNPNFDSHVISERVKNLATQIYQELKRIISRCNYDEDVLSGLMPLIVRVLESLDLALIENQQLQVELELCKDDNEQLVMMFEKEKVAKRAIDKKLIESEYAYEEERQQHQQKIESLENIVKMFELKSKNASDQAARLEEKEAERVIEYNKLHDRYSDLLKSHCDVMERVRHLLGNEATDVAHLSNLNVPSSMVSSSDTTDHPVGQQASRVRLKSNESLADNRGNLNKRNVEPTPLGVGRSVWNDPEISLEDASLVVIEDDMENVSTSGDKGHHRHEERNEQDNDHESGDKDSITYTSMEREFRKLIQENKDLLNTKNALNVVKDDLIAEVDRLSNVVSMYEQEIKQLSGVKEQLRQKNTNLEADLRKAREELTKAQQKIKENDEEGVPYSQRKRFSRVEMAKVLMERNNYKEKLIELQDAVRYTEHVRQNKMETEKRSGLWKFFSNLFGAQNPAIGMAGTPTLANSRNSSPVVSYHSSGVAPENTQGIPTGFDVIQNSSRLTSRSAQQRLTTNADLVLLMDADLASDRNRAMRSSREMADRVHAYGWSLPATASSTNTTPVKNFQQDGQQSGCGSNSGPSSMLLSGSTMDGHLALSSGTTGGKLQVPVPLYCRPLSGDSLGMKIWCATAIDLSGGDSSSNNGQSLDEADPANFGQNSLGQRRGSSSSAALKTLEAEVDRALKKSVNKSARQSDQVASATQDHLQGASSSNQEPPVKQYSSDEEISDVSTCVWICSTQHSRSKITIIDIKNKPNDVLDSFYVQTYLFCIKSMPGAKSSDLLNLAMQQEKSSSLLAQLLDDSPDIYKLIKVDKDAEIQLRQRKYKSSLNQQASLDKCDPAVASRNPADRANVQKFQSSTLANNFSSREDERDAEISRILDDNTSVGVATLQKLEDYVAHTQPSDNNDQAAIVSRRGPQNSNATTTTTNTTNNNNNNNSHPGASTSPLDSGSDLVQGHPLEEDSTAIIYYQPISTYLPTVWMGGKDCTLYVHSSIGQWKDCVACVKLPDSIIHICHHRGRAFIALANGQLCVFMRDSQTKQWDFSQYLIVDVGNMADNLVSPTAAAATLDGDNQMISNIQDSSGDQQTQATPVKMSRGSMSSAVTPKKKTVSGIRCLELANGNLWIGYRNMIFIMDTVTLKIRHNFNVVPQMDNQVRQLVSMKDGVFCCLRSDLILRLYSSLRPYQHIQDIDIEPLVTRMISPKTFVISRITALKAVDNVLWIGNAHGIILTIPCDLNPQASETRASSSMDELDTSLASGDNNNNDGLTIARYVPKCDGANAQISFHGHKDAVKFFVHTHKLMLSGGEGYFDFRLNLDDQSKSTSSSDKSHLILWQLFK